MAKKQDRLHHRLFDMELDVLKDCIDKCIYDIKRFYNPPQYAAEVEYSRDYFVGFMDKRSLRQYRPDAMAYFDRRVLEVLAEDEVE